jgi:hypothetical protein
MNQKVSLVEKAHNTKSYKELELRGLPDEHT